VLRLALAEQGEAGDVGVLLEVHWKRSRKSVHLRRVFGGDLHWAAAGKEGTMTWRAR